MVGVEYWVEWGAWLVAWFSGKFSEFSGVTPAWPMCGTDKLDSDGHVVELDDVVEMPAMTISAILGSVVAVLVPGFSLSVAKLEMLI